jgi:TPR repeat protein
LPAIVNLAHHYASGKGVEKDDDKAMQLYRQASDAGYPPAMRQLADRYMRGNGVRKNEEMAVQLLREAARVGDASAVHCAGRTLSTGERCHQG